MTLFATSYFELYMELFLQWPTVTYSDLKMTYIDPTHHLLPLPFSSDP